MLQWPRVDLCVGDESHLPGAEKMSLYVVERYVPGITLVQLCALQQAAAEICERFVAEGNQVRYLRSSCNLDESRCVCLFEAGNREIVEEVNDVAQLPYSRVRLATKLGFLPS